MKELHTAVMPKRFHASACDGRVITVLSVEIERRRDCRIGEFVKVVLLLGAAFSELASRPERKNARAPGAALLWKPVRNAAAENIGVGCSAESSRVCNIVRGV